MKKSFLFFLLLFTSVVAFSQELLIQNNEKGFYITHTVNPKENFYSISRTYNVPPKEIAAFNGLDMATGLGIGQTVMIPLTSSNFSQSTDAGTPVYYVVGEKEGLYRVSTKNNKVLMASLRKWNNLSSDNLSAGTKLIVGFLVGADMQNKNDVAKKDDDEKEQKKDLKKQEKDLKEQAKKSKKENSVSDPAVVNTVNTNQSGNSSGYFKSQFDLQAKTYPVSKDETVTAGIFKTASGWQDGKYYALIDNVEPGTIIRIINPTNNKSVYAKVLGQMSGIRQNQGLDLRISNAAASMLEVSETDKFIVKVNY